ncbi:MAG: 4-(cytidine 5'-diphospho)-2-C-methyl-D-erythritol kinase [Bacteroidaceae bacterium]|nr:4-(cytidine 5'-diphospho)-2-C-methyl-D-erythritol kinase [Bacteroidaceae bacterium]
MITFPNAKINIGLYVTSRRPDGYHNLETLFYPIELRDILEIVPAQGSESSLTVTGIAVDGDPEQNLVMRAYRLLQKEYNVPAVDIYLHKVIPFGAGLGGGSADAAYALVMLRDMFNLPLSDDELAQRASRLGADCPFFIYNRPLIATGIGDCFTSTNFSLKGLHIVLVKPSIAVSTAEAYAHVTPQNPQTPLADGLSQPTEQWRECVSNDFEKSVFPAHPRIAAIKQRLYDMGAVYASMSGSGSSVFGIFDKPCNDTDSFADCFVWQGECKV